MFGQRANFANERGTDRAGSAREQAREWTTATIQHLSELGATGERDVRADEFASFATEHVDGGVVLRVCGEIDMLTTPRLREALSKLIDSRPRVVVLDLAAVSFFASSGLASLIQAREAAVAADVQLRLACLNRSVRRPLQITGLEGRFEIYQDVQTALQG